ncbi:MAG: carboxypeptidase-like regulatory domain-containing protein [Acidobacteriota bacterium]
MSVRSSVLLILIILLYNLVCTAQTSARQVQEASLSGQALTVQVFSGQVISEEGLPVSDALIIFLDCSYVPVDSARTDAGGNFRLEANAGKLCLMRVQKERYIPFDIEKEAFPPPGEKWKISLRRASKISGEILDGGSFSPLRGAFIRLMKPEDERADQTIGSAKTDESGRYSFQNIAAGKYLLEVQKEGYLSSSETLSLRGGEQKSANVFLFKKGSLNGIVFDDERNPIENASIELSKSLSPFFREKGKTFDGGEYITRSAKEGKFSIDDIPAYGGYRFSVSAEGFAPRIVQKEIQPGTNLLTITMQRASCISGKMRWDKEKLPGDSEIEIKPHSEEIALGCRNLFQKRHRPDPSGSFRIADLPAGSFTLTINSSEFLPEVYEVLHLKPGEVRDLGVIKLRAGLRISGGVENEKGEKLKKARIKASLSGSGGRLYAKSAETADDGSFSIDGLKDGIYTIHAEANGYTEETRKGIRAGTRNLLFTLGASGKIQGMVADELGKPLERFYIFLEPEGKDAINGKYYTFSSETGSYEIGNVAPGFYSIIAGAIGFSEDSMKGVEIFNGADTEGINFYLKKGAKIDGYVYDREQGLPLPGTHVTVPFRSGGEALTAITDHSGYFTLDGVPLQFISLVVEHPDYAPAVIDGIDPTGKESSFPLKINLEGGGMVEGYVLEADDSPVHGARLSIQHGKISQDSISDMSGYYRIEHVPSGTHSIAKILPRMDLYSDYESREFTIRNNDILRIDFKSLTEASGYLTRRGVPVEGGRVSFIEAPEQSQFDPGKLSARSSYTDSTGFYKVRGLKDGRYTVVIENAEKRFIKVVDIPRVKEFREPSKRHLCQCHVAVQTDVQSARVSGYCKENNPQGV